MGDLDSTLLRNNKLAGPAQEALAQRKLRQGRSNGEDSALEDESSSLRQRIAAKKKALNLKEKAKEKVMSPMSQATKGALRWAWFSLIPSFGLSLIYINMHVFLRWVFPSAFCKLGEEWIPKQVQATSGSAGKTGGKAIGIVEVMGLLILDILLIFITISALGLLSLIVSAIASPLKAIWDLGWGGIQALIDLF